MNCLSIHIEMSRKLIFSVCLLLNILRNVASTAVYMDHYGQCSKHWSSTTLTQKSTKNYFPVTSDSVTLLPQGSRSSSSFYTKSCTITFKANEGGHLCVDFSTFNIPECGINLKIFDKDTASGHNVGRYSCNDEPESLCSSGKYLTFQLNKPSVSFIKGLEFEIKIRESDEMEENEGSISLAVIVGIPCGIIVVILCVFLSVKCCCCYKKKHKKYEKTSTTTDTPLEPSAPPAPDYTEHDPLPHSGAPHQNNSARSYHNPDIPPEAPPPYTEKSSELPFV